MDQRTIESCSFISTKESLTTFGSIDQREGIHPSSVFAKINKGKLERPFCPEFKNKTRALQRALNRLAGWDLPGKEHVEEYFRHMYRRNFRPKTYASNNFNLGSVHANTL